MAYNMHLNDQEPTSIEQLKPVISKTNLLASVMADQHIFQVAIFSIETFNGTRSRFESWIASVENTAQNPGQNVLHMAFFKMVGSPLTSAWRLRDYLQHLTCDNLKNECLRLYSTLPFDCHAMLPCNHLATCNKALMSYLRCTYILLVSFCQMLII